MDFAFMRDSLLNEAGKELWACASMDPIIVLGIPAATGKLTAYSHLRALAQPVGAKQPAQFAGAHFPYDLEPARMAYRRDEVTLFGIVYGAWLDRQGEPVSLIPTNLTPQSGLVTVVGDRTRIDAVYHPYIIRDDSFVGYELTRPITPPEVFLQVLAEDEAGVERIVSLAERRAKGV